MQISIGRKISNFRRTHNVTIRELSDATGLSTALISQLERGIGNPTISALASLAGAMGITLSDLVATSVENGDLICRRGDRKVLRDDDELTLLSVLVENALNASLTVLQLELKPHGVSCMDFDQHIEEECLCVISGEMIVTFDDGEEFTLGEGDSIRVLPHRRHKIRNDRDETAVAMNIKCKVQY